jgi:hypothetical protein
LVAQAVSVGYAHFGPAADGQSWTRKTVDGCSAEPVGCRRYFAWAPNDYLVEYKVAVALGKRRLSATDGLRRYHLPPPNDDGKSYWEDPPQRLVDTIKAFEQNSGRRDARVRLTYTVNGGSKHEWRWRGA